MIRLSHFINEASHPAAGNGAAQQAKQRGLTSAGWGRWKDKTGKTVAKTVDGKLVNIKQAKQTPKPANKVDKPAIKKQKPNASDRATEKPLGPSKAETKEAKQAAAVVMKFAHNYLEKNFGGSSKAGDQKLAKQFQNVAYALSNQEWKNAIKAIDALPDRVYVDFPGSLYGFALKKAGMHPSQTAKTANTSSFKAPSTPSPDQLWDKAREIVLAQPKWKNREHYDKNYSEFQADVEKVIYNLRKQANLEK